MPRLIVGLASVLAAGALSVLTPAPANASALACLDDWNARLSAECLAFDTDGNGWLMPDATVTVPVTGEIPAGSTIPVTITGVDLLQAATIGIHSVDDYADAEPANLVTSTTIAPGALTATVNVPVGTTPGEHQFVAYVDTYDIDGLYVDEYFEVTVATPPKAPTSLTSDLPPGRIVKVNTKSQAVTGTVSGGARPVHLQVRAKGNAWVSVAQTTSAANGSYALAVPTFWVGNHTYRAFAPEHGDLAAAEASKTGSVKVKRSYKPKGSTAHTFLFGGARWNACAPIRYSVNTSMMPKWANKEIRFALREATAATGLRFVKAAGTDHVPFARKEKPFPEHADLVVAFSTPNVVPGLRGSTIGWGGGKYSGNHVMEGGVVFDVKQKANKKAWRQIVLHEFGHALGLGHVGDGKQVMFPMSNGSVPLYAKGDLRGLSAVGAGAGACTGTETQDRVNARTPHGRTPSMPVHEVGAP